MKNLVKVFLVYFGLFSFAQAVESDVGALITCASATETRTLSIAQKDGGCELIYEKNEKLNIAASSANGTAHCEKALDKIRTSLKSAGWRCGI